MILTNRLAFSSPETVVSRLELHNNRPSGFDYLRLGLSLAVLIWHSFYLTYGEAAKQHWPRALILLILPMFFALSGFLISSSLVRTKSLTEFLTLRAVRIMPALTVEVLLSAFIIGLLFTTLPIYTYLSDPVFRTYFLNIIGDIQFKLPGVFETNPTSRINQSLWTIPYELYCYVAIVVLWLIGAITRPRLILLIVVAMQAALPVRDFLRGEVIKYDEPLPGRMLILAFLCGVLIYFYRDKIVLRGWLFAAAVVACFVLLASVYTSYLVAFPAAYITVFLGLTNPRKIPVIFGGDYSYGIYLYSAPIQQAMLNWFPDHRVWWFNLGTAIIPICLFAAFSWHIIEKPVLGRRKSIVAAVSWLFSGDRWRRLSPGRL